MFFNLVYSELDILPVEIEQLQKETMQLLLVSSMQSKMLEISENYELAQI